MLSRRMVPAVFGVFLAVSATLSTWADVPRLAPPPKDSLQEVLDHIRDHAASGAWQKEGWKDEAIESWLDKLVAAIATGTGKTELKLPVRLADVKPVDPKGFRVGGLLVGTDLKVPGLQNSIVLADGNIEATVPRNCVLVARGVVSVSGARNCVIVAGACVTGTHDGEPGAGGSGSVIVSRGWIDMDTAYGSILVGSLGMTVGRSQEALFVNADLPPLRNGFDSHRGSKSVKVPNLPLEPLPTHPLASKIKLLGVVQAPAKDDPISRRRQQASGALFRLDGRRYVADLGEPIVDEAGNPVESLRDWELAHASERIAIFRNGDVEVVVRAETK